MAAETPKVPYNEADAKKLKEIMEEESTTPTLYNRAQILQELMNGKTEEEIIREFGFSKPTITNLRKNYLENGIESIYPKKRGGKPGTSVQYNGTFDVQLGLAGPGPSLVYLYMDDYACIAVIRRSSSFNYDDKGEGSISVKGKYMTTSMESASEKGPVLLKDALNLAEEVTFNPMRWPASWQSNLYEYVDGKTKDYDQYDICVHLEEGQEYALEMISDGMRRRGRSVQVLGMEKWIRRIDEVLRTKTPVDGDPKTKDSLVKAIRQYHARRIENSLPFIWTARKQTAIEMADRSEVSRKHMSEGETQGKNLTMTVNFELPEMNPGDTVLLTNLILLEKMPGGKTVAKGLTETAAAPGFHQKSVGIDVINDIEEYAGKLMAVLNDMQRKLSHEMIQYIFNSILNR